jgi:hypothetical protein
MHALTSERTHAGQTEKVTVDTTAAVNGNGKPSGAAIQPILPQNPFEGLFRLETIARAERLPNFALKVRGQGLESSEECVETTIHVTGQQKCTVNLQ